jgi:NAD-dependent dihydropyrimidine dehydrogenase PreA subunit
LKAHDADERESQAIKAQAQDMTAHLRAFNKRIAEIEGAGPVQSVSTGGQQSYLPDREWDFVRMTAVVDKERCSCCRFCMDICPELAITMNDTAVIDPYKCTACGSCIDECPTEAISLSRMKKRTAS